jgi:hypothetical protein
MDPRKRLALEPLVFEVSQTELAAHTTLVHYGISPVNSLEMDVWHGMEQFPVC